MRKKLQKIAQRSSLSDAQIKYLETGVLPEADEGFWDCFDWPGIAEDWQRVEAAILKRWIAQHPGSRPWSWWKWSAPRPSVIPAALRGTIWEAGYREPRARIGGPPREPQTSAHCAVNFSFGMPDEIEADAYDNPDDWPKFESEPAYLIRHHLLTPGEAAVLTADAFAPVIRPPESWRRVNTERNNA